MTPGWMANHNISALVWFVGVIAAVIVGAAVVDDRYAHAVDFRLQSEQMQTMNKSQSAQVDGLTSKLQTQIEYNADRQRKRLLEDQILRYDLTLDRDKKPIDRVLVQRYKSELQEMQERWNRARMPLQ